MNLVGLIVISLALGVLAWLAFVWSVRSGQYDDPEGPKYRMLEDEEEAPGPPAARPGPAPAPPGAHAGDEGEGRVRGRSQGQTPDRS